MLKKLFFATIGFIGWILSPFTWWNDAFVNLPLAYIAASLINRFTPNGFLPAFLVSYWLTNILGILLMYVGAENLIVFKAKKRVILTTIIVYSIISALLIGFKIVRPF